MERMIFDELKTIDLLETFKFQGLERTNTKRIGTYGCIGSVIKENGRWTTLWG